MHELISVGYFKREHERVQAVIAKLEHFLVDSSLRVDGGTERDRVLSLYILRHQAALQVLDQPAQHRQEMLCSANISWHRLLQYIVRQCRIPQPCIRYLIHESKDNNQQANLSI